MSPLDSLWDSLWEHYELITPQARQIHDLLEDRGHTIINDHIALRTFQHPSINKEVQAKPFLELGYRVSGFYEFEDKKLEAIHLQHDDESKPKVFISELRYKEFSPKLQEKVEEAGDEAHGLLYLLQNPFTITYQDYLDFAKESEYAAWTMALGFIPNHFTISINHTNFSSIQKLNEFLKDEGFDLNTVGGEVKGSPDLLLEQSATLSSKVLTNFSDGIYSVPGCFYEFALRYNKPNGKLFHGFVANNADKIFHSTDRKKIILNPKARR